MNAPKRSLLLSCLAVGTMAAATGGPSYPNPVLYADYSDPDVIRAGNAFYLVASTFAYSPGLPVLRSEDLVHWTQVSHVVSRLTLAPEYDLPGPVVFNESDGPKVKSPVGQRYGGGIWAPAVREHGGLFYVYWPTPGEGIFVSTAPDMAGPWSAPVVVLSGPGYEDPCPLWDDDGKAYLIHSVLGAGPLILHRMAPDGKSLLDQGTIVVRDAKGLPTLEGPKLYKRHGWYYIFAPFGGVSTGSQAVLRSRSIYGPYERRVVLSSGSSGVPGPHQGAYVEGADGRGWFLHFSSHGAFGRIDYLEPVDWVDDWPVMGDHGQPVATVTGAQPQADISNGLLSADDFSRPVLGEQWEWNHNPDDHAWSLTEQPGRLRLHALPARNLLDARNTLTQVLIGPTAQYEVRLELGGLTDGQLAGLSMFGMQPSWIGIAREQGALRVAVSTAGVRTDGPSWQGRAILLRATVGADQTVRYAFAESEEGPFQALGPACPMRFSWWKGARPALFSYTTAGKPGGYADFARFERRP